jgi:amino acid transporter
VPAPPASLVRALGRWTLAALVVNSIIGSGVFGLPSVISRLLGPLAPWAWLAGAAGNGLVMLCFAEVASRFSGAGGAYLYAREALPRWLAIQVGWLALLTRLSAAAAGVNLFVVNLEEFWPSAARREVQIGVLTLLLGGLAAINYLGVGRGAAFSNLFTVGKLLPLAIFVLSGAWYLGSHGAAAAPPAVAAGAAEWLRASLLIAFAYGGYDGAMLAMGEARDPRRDAPFGLIVAMIFLAILYTSVQLVVDATVPDAAASTRPLVDSARLTLGSWGGGLLAVAALISVVGYLGANFLNAPRLMFAMAEHHDVPDSLRRVHASFHTPHVAILLFGAGVWALALYGNFEWNAMLSAVARLLVYGCTCSALLVLRRRDPEGARLRLPGGALFAWLGIAFCVLLASRLGGPELIVLAVASSVALAHWALLRRFA